jgi:hypothetical protein
MDNRGLSSVVGKLLGAGLVLLYVSGATTVLVGDVVPEARRVTGQELSERIVADAATRIERAVEPVEGRLRGRLDLSLPATIADAGYRLGLENRTVVLDHPDPGIGATAPLGLPRTLSADAGWVDSGAGVAVTVRGSAGNRTVGLEEAGA